MDWLLGLSITAIILGVLLVNSMRQTQQWMQTRIDYWYELYKETRQELDKFQGGKP